MKDYNIVWKILFVLTVIKNPIQVLFDKIGLKDNFVYSTYSGIKFITRAKTSDINEAVAILSDREYPKEILNISYKKRPAVIDAGAHIGTFTLYVKSLNHSVKIFAIEPLDKNIIYLKKNLTLNRIKGVSILPYALSDEKGLTKLWLSDVKFDNASISLSRKNQQVDTYGIVPTNTLGGIIKDLSIQEIDVLKMDIEGMEYKVLKKDIKLITKIVERLLIEYHTDSDRRMREKIISLLKDNNFKLIFERRHILGFLNKVFAAKKVV